MNREIKFRGKSSSTNDWIFGYLIVIDNKCCIFQPNATIKCIGRYGDDNFGEISQSGQDYITQIYTESVGQCTGLKDKNGVEIYEGDIISNGHDTCLVTWRQDLASFALSKDGWAYDHYFGEAVDPGYVEVIGNIYQNAELL